MVQCLIAVGGDVGLNSFGINLAAVGQDDGQLLFEKGSVQVAELQLGFAAFKGVDKFNNVFRRDLFVKRAIRVHTHQRAFAAKFHAADAANLHLVAQAGVFDRLFEIFFYGFRVGGHAAGGHAAADDRFFAGGQFLLGDYVEIINDHWKSILSCVRPRFPGFDAA